MPGPKIDKAEHGERGENQSESVVDGRRIVEAAGELAEDRRADADDHGEHEDLHPRRDDIAEHLLSEEGGAAKEAERNQDESGQGRQLELDQADKELDRHDEEADDDDEPGDQQDGDLDEIVEEAGETHQTGDGGQDGLSGVDADLGHAPRLKKLRRAQRAASGLDPEAGERVVNNLSEIVVVGDDVGEDADVERFPDQPGDHVLVRRQYPEETGKRDVDGDEHAGEPADVALDEAKA